jgi:hypothetical protein
LAGVDSAAALRRYGVALTDAEVGQIDALAGMEKTKALVAVMERQYGGLAAVVGKTFDGALRIATESSGDLDEALGDLVETGPTRTNVNDFRALLIA